MYGRTDLSLRKRCWRVVRLNLNSSKSIEMRGALQNYRLPITNRKVYMAVSHEATVIILGVFQR
jgi:hypothetical protein